jgi:hypothetical protein
MESVSNQIDSKIFEHCKLLKMSRQEFSTADSTGNATLKQGKNRFRGFTLGKSIHLYRMWFLLLKVAYDCEIADLKFGPDMQDSVKINRKFYGDWEIEKYIERSFDEFFLEKIHLFGEESVGQVSEIDDIENYIFLKVRKNSRKEDVIKDVRNILTGMKYNSSVKYQIKRQHKYFYLHQQYNVFLMRQSGWDGSMIGDWLNLHYGKYRARVVSSAAAKRKLYRSSERIVLDVAAGEF